MTGIEGRPIELNRTAHKTDLRTRTKNMRFHPFVSTSNAPRKGTRGVPAELEEAIPLNEIKYNEQRDAETGYSHFGASFMDHELMTMWLSVDLLADKYPNISPYAYCVWNPVRLVDPDRNDWYVPKGQSTPIFDKNVTSNNCPEGATYLGKTAHWFGQTENNMQYYYHGAEDGALSKQDMTVTIFGNKDGYDSQYGILDGLSDYYGAASTAWRNAKNKDKSKSLYTLKKNGMLGTAIGAGIGAITGGISGEMESDAVGKKIYKWTK